MPGSYPWIERTFEFSYPAEKVTDLLERPRGTPARLEDLVREVPSAWLTRKVDDGWTIQQTIL